MMRSTLLTVLLSLGLFVFAQTANAQRPSLGGLGTVCRSDADCRDVTFCNGAEVCAPGHPAAGRDGCMAGTPPCLSDETCNEARGVCELPCGARTRSDMDRDGDGHKSIECGGDDCDDNNAQRYPGNVEVCDARGLDEDCNYNTIGHLDRDGDGYTDAQCYNIRPR